MEEGPAADKITDVCTRTNQLNSDLGTCI